MLRRFIPNFLSLSRIFVVPFFFYTLLGTRNLIAVVLLIIGAITDFLDGYFARRLNTESKLGELLDPLADKLFANSVLWGLCIFYSPALPLLILAICLTSRDIALMLGSAVVITKRIQINIKPVFISKVCTTFVFVYIILIMILENNNIALPIIGYTSIILTVLTFLIYSKRFFSGFKKSS